MRGDEQEALTRKLVEVAQPHSFVVDEQDRKREGEDRRVHRSEEAALAAIRDAARRIGKCGVRDQGETELAEGEEHSEDERIVAVSQLAREERETGRDHQRAQPVAGST